MGLIGRGDGAKARDLPSSERAIYADVSGEELLTPLLLVAGRRVVTGAVFEPQPADQFQRRLRLGPLQKRVREIVVEELSAEGPDRVPENVRPRLDHAAVNRPAGGAGEGRDLLTDRLVLVPRPPLVRHGHAGLLE